LLIAAAALVGVIGCPKQRGPDYFPLVAGAKTYMSVYTREVVDAETTERTRVKLTASVRGEEDIPDVGRLFVVEAPQDSGPPIISYFRKERSRLVQVVPVRGKPPMEMAYLEYPLEVGKSWFDTERQRQQFQVVARETVTVKAGTFPDCYKLAIISTGVDWAMHQWLAPGVGPVKWENRASWTRDGKTHEVVNIAELVEYRLPGELPKARTTGGK